MFDWFWDVLTLLRDGVSGCQVFWPCFRCFSVSPLRRSGSSDTHVASVAFVIALGYTTTPGLQAHQKQNKVVVLFRGMNAALSKLAPDVLTLKQTSYRTIRNTLFVDLPKRSKRSRTICCHTSSSHDVEHVGRWSHVGSSSWYT